MDYQLVKYRVGAKINRFLKYGATALLLIFIGLFFIWPITKIFIETINATTFIDTLFNKSILIIFLRTLLQAFLSTLITLIIGITPAYLLSKWNFKFRKILSALIVVPFALPSVVVGAAFLSILPDSLHNTLIAIIVVHVFFNIAVIVKIVGTTWESIPNDLPDSALTLGSTKLKSFRYVTLPLLLPSIISACSIIFIFCFTSYGAILVIGGARNSTIEVEIARQALTFGEVATSSTLSLLQIIFMCIVIFISIYISNKHKNSISSTYRQYRTISSNKHKIAISLGSIIVASIVLIPIISLVLSSVKYKNKISFFAWTHLNAYEIRPGITNGINFIATLNSSLKIVLVSVVISTTIGLIASITIHKTKQIKRIIEPLFMLPIGVSAVSLGLGILIAFSTSPMNWRSNWLLIPIGHSLIAIPFFIRTMLPVLKTKSKDLTNASYTLGSTKIRSIWEIDIKRTTGALSKSIGFSAAISLGEFGATSLLTKTGNDTMPIAIAKLLNRPGEISHLQAYMISTVLALTIGIIVFIVEVKNA